MGITPEILVSLRDIEAHDGDHTLMPVNLSLYRGDCFVVLTAPDTSASLLCRVLAGELYPSSGHGCTLNHTLPSPLISQDRRIGYLPHSVPKDRLLDGLRALIDQDAEFLILDQPTRDLSSADRESLAALIKGCRPQRTVFLTSSSLADVRAFATHAAFLDQGTFILADPFDKMPALCGAVVFEVALEGNAAIVLDLLRSMAWVVHVAEVKRKPHSTWLIWMRNDPDAASRLLRVILADRTLAVLQFNRVRQPPFSA